MPVQLRAAAIAAGVLVVAVSAFLLLRGRATEIPMVGAVLGPRTCPLTGLEPRDEAVLERPAVGVKVENSSAAWPLSGLERADVVYEEVVEGGITRFLALYHCANTSKAGPVRSARLVDAAIMTPATRILAFSGANGAVMKALNKADIVTVTEGDTGDAMRRVERPGVSSEHTLYADPARVRRAARKRFDDPPPDDLFEFGSLEGRSKRARTLTITFSAATTIDYTWRGGEWQRSQGGEPFMTEAGKPISVDNVLIEQHTVNLSQTIRDVAGNPSVEIEDVTGSGPAVLFRDGRAIRGRWIRDRVEDAVRFETRSGEPMVLHPGTTWIELVPNAKGDVKGSFSFAR